MSRGFFDNNKDVDTEAAKAHRRSFLERMNYKLEMKEAGLTPDFR